MTIAVPYSARPWADRQELSLLLILIGGACTGFSGILVRLSEIGTIATGGWRLGIATLVLLPFAARAGAREFSGTREFSWRPSPILVIAGLFFSVDMCFYHWSLAL